MITTTELARPVAATLLVVAVAAGCAAPTEPTVDPVAAPSAPASPTPEDPPPSPAEVAAPEPSREPSTPAHRATAEPSSQPAQAPEPDPTEPPPDHDDDLHGDDLSELPSFDSGGGSPAIAMTITLHADAATGCMRIALQRSEDETQVYATRFNQQYRGRFTTDPPELVRTDDETGEPVVVAAAGETFTGAAQRVEGNLDECHVGPENTIALLY